MFFYWSAQGEQEILGGVYEGELHVTRKSGPADSPRLSARSRHTERQLNFFAEQLF